MVQSPEIMTRPVNEKEEVEVEVEDKGDLVRQRILEIERNQKKINKSTQKTLSNPEQKSQKSEKTIEKTSEKTSEKISEKKVISKPNLKSDQKINFDSKNKGIVANKKIVSRSPLPLSLPLSDPQKTPTDLKEIGRKEKREKQRQEFESFKMNKRAARKMDMLGEVSDGDFNLS